MTNNDFETSHHLPESLDPNQLFRLSLFYVPDGTKDEHWNGSLEFLETGERVDFGTLTELIYEISEILKNTKAG